MTRLRCLGFALALIAPSASCSSAPPAAAAESISTTSSPHDGHSMGGHGDHTPHHGGVVYMNGDLHFEVVLGRDGSHRVYFSDAMRAALPAATASEVTLAFSNAQGTGEALRAEVDENGESWIVTGPPLNAPDVTVRVAFVVGDEPYWIDVPFVDSGAAALSTTAPTGQ